MKRVYDRRQKHARMDSTQTLRHFMNKKNIRPSRYLDMCVFPQKLDIMQNMARDPSVKKVLEIGFHAGHVADVFLRYSGGRDIMVMSIDTGEQPCVYNMKRYIDDLYPRRHVLFIGESTHVLRTVTRHLPAISFDVILINGSRSQEQITSDVMSCRIFAHSTTIVIVNDVVPTYDACADHVKNASQAYHSLVASGVLRTERMIVCGKGYNGMAIATFCDTTAKTEEASSTSRSAPAVDVARRHEDLNAYIGTCEELEGHSAKYPKKTEDLFQIAKSESIRRISEIGFNAGHSTTTFLTSNPSAFMLSFDLGMHNYVVKAKSFVDSTFPGMHLLVIGSSHISVPAFIKLFPACRFDLIFIDGCHTIHMALTDIQSYKPYAHEETIVLLDDAMLAKTGHSWIDQPSDAWKESIRCGIIKHSKEYVYSLESDSRLVNGIFEGRYCT